MNLFLTFLEMDVDLSELILQESEVSAAKYMHFEEIIAALEKEDPSFVPCDLGLF